jgi:hypothetical protein
LAWTRCSISQGKHLIVGSQILATLILVVGRSASTGKIASPNMILTGIMIMAKVVLMDIIGMEASEIMDGQYRLGLAAELRGETHDFC